MFNRRYSNIFMILVIGEYSWLFYPQKKNPNRGKCGLVLLLKKFLYLKCKQHIKKIKHRWRKLFTIYKTDKGLVFPIYKSYYKSARKQIKMEK